MSYHGQKLINIIKDKVSSVNLELIYSEFQYIEESNKIEISSDIICQLISIVGNYNKYCRKLFGRRGKSKNTRRICNI